MKTILYILAISLPLIGFTQERRERNLNQSREKIETAKIGYLTKKLDLTTAEAQSFWPIYNEYNDKRFELKKSMLKDRIENFSKDEETEVDWEKKLKAMTEMRKKEFALEEEYKSKFLKVLSAKQVVLLFKSEKDFMDMLRSKISHKEGRRDEFDPKKMR